MSLIEQNNPVDDNFVDLLVESSLYKGNSRPKAKVFQQKSILHSSTLNGLPRAVPNYDSQPDQPNWSIVDQAHPVMIERKKRELKKRALKSSPDSKDIGNYIFEDMKDLFGYQ